MTIASCPACGSGQDIPGGSGGFRCKQCQRDVWILRCRRCSNASFIYGSATGAGLIEFRCTSCKARNTVAKQVLRNISADARRLERAALAARREAVLRDKEARAHHTETQQAKVVRLNGELQATLEAIRSTLASSLASAHSFGFGSLKTAPSLPEFVDPSPPAQPPPDPAAFSVPPLSGVGSLIPGAKRKHESQVQEAQAAFQQARQAYDAWEAQRQASSTAARAEYDRKVVEIRESAQRQNADVDELERRFKQADADSVIEYMTAVLGAMALPYEPVGEPRVTFSPQSHQLVVELELPSFESMPAAREYRYVKARDEITEAALPAAERKSLYASLVSQLALQAVHEAFRADPHGVVETVVLNAHVHTVDKRTGQDIHPCLVTLRTTRDRFAELNLGQVDPSECLRGLNASLSKSPAELAPVRPLLEFDMADPRFVQESDILSTLDTRPNLMELSPKEFESLITNLFEKMGLETKLTQASRDGGVDCVAYDVRPIFGGKVVIQAKRYKNTVGVSAVRDLFGTMQNEGATKGILVTTSGYGQASHDFANGKPLELIDGANLLYLLHEHAEIDAKIEPPEDWVDPAPEQ